MRSSPSSGDAQHNARRYQSRARKNKENTLVEWHKTSGARLRWPEKVLLRSQNVIFLLDASCLTRQNRRLAPQGPACCQHQPATTTQGAGSSPARSVASRVQRAPTGALYAVDSIQAQQRMGPRMNPLVPWSRVCTARSRPPFKLYGRPQPEAVGVTSCSCYGRGVRVLSLRAPFCFIEPSSRKALLSKGGTAPIIKKSRPLKLQPRAETRSVGRKEFPGEIVSEKSKPCCWR